MSEEDIPPENIWHDDVRLREWFDAVKQRRKDVNSPSASGERMEEVPLTQNEYTKEVLGAS